MEVGTNQWVLVRIGSGLLLRRSMAEEDEGFRPHLTKSWHGETVDAGESGTGGGDVVDRQRVWRTRADWRHIEQDGVNHSQRAWRRLTRDRRVA